MAKFFAKYVPVVPLLTTVMSCEYLHRICLPHFLAKVVVMVMVDFCDCDRRIFVH